MSNDGSSTSIAAPVIAGLAVGIAFVMVFSIFPLLPNSHNNKGVIAPQQTFLYEDNNVNTLIICGQPLQVVRSHADFPILTPTLLPNGYSLQYADISPTKDVFLYYYNMTICDHDNPKSLQDGAIEIVMESDKRAAAIFGEKTGKDYIQHEYQRLVEATAGNLDVRKYTFGEDNDSHSNNNSHRRYAVGYDQIISSSIIHSATERKNATGGSSSGAAIQEGNVITYHFSDMWVADDDDKGIFFRITAHMPIEELAKIAESMQ